MRKSNLNDGLKVNAIAGNLAGQISTSFMDDLKKLAYHKF